MLKLHKIITRSKLYFCSDLRRNKKHYILGVLSFLTGIALAIIFTLNCEVSELEYTNIIEELLCERSIFCSFFAFLPSILLLTLIVVAFSILKKLNFLIYIWILIWVRKIYIWGIWLVLCGGIYGILDFILYFLFLLSIFLISLLFISRCISESCTVNLCSKIDKDLKKDLFRECLILIGLILLLQLIPHVIISTVFLILL